jgi:uncharacterized protein YcbK (DUF882 family)
MIDKNMKLSEHFTLKEFMSPDSDTVPADILANLKRLAKALEGVRKLLGNKPIHITSGYRTPAHNKAVGGKHDSYHMRGVAADIEVEGWNPHDVQEELKSWSGGMGSYNTFTHLDIRPYRARWNG